MPDAVCAASKKLRTNDAHQATLVVPTLIPVGHALIFGVYWLLSRDAAGTAMSILFALAIAILGFGLLSTLNDVGPTAPVDAEWTDQR